MSCEILLSADQYCSVLSACGLTSLKHRYEQRFDAAYPYELDVVHEQKMWIGLTAEANLI